MNTTAITWLGRQIAWEARLAELRIAMVTKPAAKPREVLRPAA